MAAPAQSVMVAGVIIIAKSYSEGQLCILGFDGNRIIRLLGIAPRDQWEKQLFQLYNCRLQYECPGAIYPHKNEDTMVEEIIPQLQPVNILPVQNQLQKINGRLYEIACYPLNQPILQLIVPGISLQEDAQILQQRTRHLKPIAYNFSQVCFAELQNMDNILSLIALLANRPIVSIFPGLRGLKYVPAATNCPSASVLVCNKHNIRRFSIVDEERNRIKKRFKIRELDVEYDFPYTGTAGGDYNNLFELGDILPPGLPSPDYLIVLSLGRPLYNLTFEGPRCYVLVVGVHQI